MNKKLCAVTEKTNEKVEKTNTYCEKIINENVQLKLEIKKLTKNINVLSQEFVKSRRSDKRIEALSQALALIAIENKEFVENGTAQKICDILGIREINEKINDEIEAINIDPIGEL